LHFGVKLLGFEFRLEAGDNLRRARRLAAGAGATSQPHIKCLLLG